MKDIVKLTEDVSGARVYDEYSNGDILIEYEKKEDFGMFVRVQFRISKNNMLDVPCNRKTCSFVGKNTVRLPREFALKQGIVWSLN